MGEYNPSSSTTTNLNSLSDYNIDNKVLDYANDGDTESYWYFTNSSKHYGYYKNVPIVKKAVDALAMWTAGKGYTVLNSYTKVMLEKIDGWGEDTIDSIFENLLVTKKVIGDAFAEIIREKDYNNNNRIINIKPVSPERVRVVVDNKGLIIRYDVLSRGKWQPINKNNMLHLCNDRLGDEIHGTSALECCEWAIKAREEAMDTYRKIMKRSLALGIMYVDTSDQSKITTMMNKYKDAINKGEVLVLPKDTAEMKDFKPTVQNFIEWIIYLENYIYISLGVPKIIMGGSQDYTEASSKVGYLTFEQVYMSEQRKLEQDLWNQLGIKILFDRPVSLKDNIQQSEAANTGQLGLQPKEQSINMERE